MTSKLFVSLSVSLVLLIAFASAAQKPGSSTAVALRVTVEPTVSGGTACRICGDGLGEYIDGVDGMSASFTKYGWLSIAFQDRATLRTVNFDYSSPGNPTPPPVLPVYHPQVTSGVDSNKILQDMRSGTTYCIGLGWSHDDGNNITRNHGYQFGPHVTGSSYAMITCTAPNNMTEPCIEWTVEPVTSTCNAVAGVTGINDRITTRGKTTDYDRGLFTMPFRLTLRRK